MPLPTAYFRVKQPMIGPIPARPGEFIALWMSHPKQTLSVISADRQQVLRTANVPLGAVTGQLLHLCLDDVVIGLSPSDVALLVRVA
jgi:hypothetical protein